MEANIFRVAELIHNDWQQEAEQRHYLKRVGFTPKGKYRRLLSHPVQLIASFGQRVKFGVPASRRSPIFHAK